jgi:ribosome-binding factor A
VDDIRRRRLEEQLREEIAALILGGEVKDPRVDSFVSVTRVEAARDMSVAKVYISTFALGTGAPPPAGGAADGAAPAGEGKPARDPEEDRLQRAVEGLQHAAGFIQAGVARRVRLRLTPRLHFIADHGIKAGFELTERIKGL